MSHAGKLGYKVPAHSLRDNNKLGNAQLLRARPPRRGPAVRHSGSSLQHVGGEARTVAGAMAQLCKERDLIVLRAMSG